MIRALLMIAAAGLVLSVGALSAAFAIGGKEAIARGGWMLSDGVWSHGRWTWDSDDGRDWGHEPASGPQTTRTLPWTGGDRLRIDLPAQVRYVQSAGPATITVTGPEGAVRHVILRDGSLRFDHRGGRWWGSALSVVMRAPDVTSFDLSGRSALSIEGYRQDKLNLDVSGAGQVTATGEVGVVDLDISGAGDVDLGGLKAKGAEVEISGAGGAVIAPTDWARLDISGMGDIQLLTQPPQLETDISGAGAIRQGQQQRPKPAAPPAKDATRL